MDTVCNQSYDFFFHFKIDNTRKTNRGGKERLAYREFFLNFFAFSLSKLQATQGFQQSCSSVTSMRNRGNGFVTANL